MLPPPISGGGEWLEIRGNPGKTWEKNDRTDFKVEFCQDLSGTALRLFRFVKRKEPEPPTGDSGRQGFWKDAEGGSSLSLPLEIVGGKGKEGGRSPSLPLEIVGGKGSGSSGSAVYPLPPTPAPTPQPVIGNSPISSPPHIPP